MIGDIDPIKAAKSGLQLGSELAMHFGLMPRANRGIFAINELPDLAGKIQVGLFNVLQEGDVQIKGFPVRMPLDIMVVFSANPEDYTARGKIITPLKDRIGAEIRTHYLDSRADAMTVTAQEAWTDRGTGVEIPSFIREAVEEVAFEARQDRRVDKRSGVSQRLPISMLESVVSNAERRALAAAESVAVPRITDLYAAIPSMTGKLELEYEGELKGADQIGRELVRGAVSKVFDGHFPDADMRQIVDWFDLGGSLDLDDLESASELVRAAGQVQGLVDMARRAGLPANPSDALVASAVDFVLEGLYSQKKISRTEGRGFHAAETARRPQPAERRAPVLTPDDDDLPGESTRKKKRYYN